MFDLVASGCVVAVSKFSCTQNYVVACSCTLVGIFVHPLGRFVHPEAAVWPGRTDEFFIEAGVGV